MAAPLALTSPPSYRARAKRGRGLFATFPVNANQQTTHTASSTLWPPFRPHAPTRKIQSIHPWNSLSQPHRPASESVMPPTVQDRFAGCFLGLAVGDALGGRFEAQLADGSRARLPTVEALIDYPQDEIWYTDDTQMAIGVAETLVAHGQIIEEHLCRAFVANYVPSRGYGWGARAVLDAMEDGKDYRAVAEKHFPGGSYGNGAAMRVGPVGLLFRD